MASDYEPLEVEHHCEHPVCHALDDAKTWILNEACKPGTELNTLLMKVDELQPIVSVQVADNKAALILAEICQNIHRALFEELLLELMMRADLDSHRN